MGSAITVPHVSMIYSVIELETAAALRRGAAARIKAGDSVQFRQFYPDRNVGQSFALHQGFVHPLAGGKVELRHDWLSGTGDVTVDSAGRVGASQLSVRDTARASIGAATFAVDYGRPLARGRTLLGDVIPYDYVWRTGANAATQFTTSAPITLAGLVAAGWDVHAVECAVRRAHRPRGEHTQTGQMGDGVPTARATWDGRHCMPKP